MDGVLKNPLQRNQEEINEIENKIKTISEFYGYDAQSRQCIEEMAELAQAINKFWRKQLKCGKVDISQAKQVSEEHMNLKEEIADVYIMLQQMMYLLGIKSIDKTVNDKLDRQLERINANGTS